MTLPGNDNRAERLGRAIRARKASAGSRVPDLPPRPVDELAHVGEMQRGLWLAHQLDPGSPAYNLAAPFRVDGRLDATRLQGALSDVVARHRVLRSTFRADRDAVLQVVHPEGAVACRTFEVADGEARATALQQAREPFDLEHGPLIRLSLIEEPSGRERILLLTAHHIIADEHSLALLWKEIATAYHGEHAELARAAQYDDYVFWQRQQNRAEHREALEYWRRVLDPLPNTLRLPFENAAREARGSRGRLLSRTLSVSVQQGIRRLAATTATSPFAVFAFAFRLLLHRYTEGQRVAFATPVSTRSHPATWDMIGYFLNPVVVSTDIDEGRRVTDALSQFGQQLRDLLAHASLPFQTLAERLAPPRLPDRHPIFQAMFVYQQATAAMALGDARLEPLTLDLGASKFDLTLFATEAAHSLEIAVEYRTDRFDDIWMQNLLGHYEALLTHLPQGADGTLARVSLTGVEEEGRLRAASRGALLDLSATPLLPEQIMQATRRQPDSPAITCGALTMTYGALEGSAGVIARLLSECGVKPGTRVGLFVDRSPWMIAGLVGIHWAGAAYVPLDPAYPSARNRDVLNDAEVTAVLTTTALSGHLPQGTWAVVCVDTLDAAKSNHHGGGDDDRLLGASAYLSSDSPAYILYTSGSTGRPKGVVVTHGNLRASTGARRRVYAVPPKRFLLVPSVAFDSSVAGLFWTLAMGGTLVVPREDEVKDPRRLAALVADEQVTSLLCVPSLYGQLLKYGGSRLGTLDTAIVAGETCSSTLVEAHFRELPHVRLFNEYGPTEATVWATVHEITPRDATSSVPIGRPIPGVEVEVLDALGRRVPTGIPGHGWIVGPTVAQGYWRRPDVTSERFDVDNVVVGSGERRYRSGDRMVWSPEGHLLFLGREDDQIKLRGFRIEPGEIEAALLEHPAIRQAAVVARAHDADLSSLIHASASGALLLVAFVEVTRPGAARSWRQDLAVRLPDHMIPSRLVELAQLPRLPNGKVDRRTLAAWPLDAEPGALPDAGIPSVREQALCSLWEGLLGRSGIGPSDNFFEMGGHSMLVVEMTSAIERDFEVTLAAADVFENPTVRGLAERIEQRGTSQAAPYAHLFPIQPGGRKTPLIFAIPHFFASMLATRFRGERPVYGLRGVGLRMEGNRGRWRTMTDLAEEIVEEIRRRFPEDGYIMAGYSFGASMAAETVRVMEARGIPVYRLYLVAPMPLDFYRLGPFRVRLDGLRKPVDEVSIAEALRLFARANHPLTRRPYSRAKRWLLVQPWRRLLAAIGAVRSRAGLPLTPRLLHADVRVERFRLHAQYRPGPIHTPTVIFNPSDTETDAAATWRPHFRGPLTVHDTPDPHDEGSVGAAREVILRHLGDMGEL